MFANGCRWLDFGGGRVVVSVWPAALVVVEGGVAPYFLSAGLLACGHNITTGALVTIIFLILVVPVSLCIVIAFVV